MTIQCDETTYQNFGRCMLLDNGVIRLMATLDVGPRIIYFGTRGNRNILFEDVRRDFCELNKGYGTWYAYGGHRLWTAPEVMPETYFPDNSRVTCDYTDGVLTLTPKATPFGKQFSLILIVEPDGVPHHVDVDCHTAVVDDLVLYSKRCIELRH